MLKLYIGNKNYSSWSMRPWVLLKQAGIVFEEVRVRFDSFDAQSEFKRTIGAVSPTAKVPVLVDGDLVVWDTLAIAEYVAETYPDKKLWPTDAKARARARSVCAEMHSGFTALRSHCPMNIEAHLPDTGADPRIFDGTLVALAAADCPMVRVQTTERTIDLRTSELRRVLVGMRLLAVAEQHRDSRRVAMATRILSRCSADAIDVIRNIDATRLTPLRSK